MRIIKIIILLISTFHLSAWASNDFKVLSFHDVVLAITPTSEIDDVSTDHLINYFSWLKENGYHVVSIQDVVNSKKGGKPLPEKSIVLTFDDGYKSFYTFVLPLLEAFNYPATLAIVGSWLDVPENGTVNYGNEKVPRSHFLSIAELKQISQSPLVEIASHTYNLHRGIFGNAEGNEMPALTTLEYDSKLKSYELESHYKSRIEHDLAKNNQWIKTHIRKSPRVIVWPYGRYNSITQNIAKKLGLEISVTLDDGENLEMQSLNGINRIYLINDPTITGFADLLRNQTPEPQRVMHVDLDYIYDQDPVQQEKNLGLLLERIKSSGVNTVYLQAFADDEGNGVAKSLYFPNRNLPLKADLFGRVSWQIRTRLGVNVYAWMPLLAFNPGPEKLKELDIVTSVDGSKGIGYLRLSPFSTRSRKFIREIYEDLSRHTYFYGIVIHDDATLSDKEDASQSALDFYRNEWGLPANINEIIADPALNRQWTRHKTEELTQFALDMKIVAEEFRKPLRISRNYYAEIALNPDAEEWFSQSIPNAVENFDWVAVMAMPYMEHAKNPDKWLLDLVAKISAYKGASPKIIYELQARDWNTRKPIPTLELSSWMRLLRINGALNFGYYPDDPFANEPKIDILKRELSTQSQINR